MTTAFNYDRARELMVEQQIRPWDVLDPRVLEVLATLPREAFVDDVHKPLAYADLALPLAHGEVMNKPVFQGRALEALRPAEGESILEIGSGSGYLSACLGRLCREVVGIERHPDLAAKAQQRVQAQAVTNVRIEAADAMLAEPGRQFDAICVGAAVDSIPERFLQWLRPGGRMFIVRGRAPAMEAVLVHADVNGPRVESLFETELPYLAGAAPVPEFAL